MPPLTGIRVLDLSTVVAGPMASMILAELGADVIKVERIDGGDDSRQIGPKLGEWGAYFVNLNRGKRSIAADISKPAGREIVLRLARTCDVFIENFRGGKAEALGVGEDSVRAQNAAIVYASLTGYGTRGPDSLKPAYDALIQGRTGIVSVTGPPDSPTRAGVSVIDIPTGMWLAIGILSALYERQQSGEGQRVDSSLYETGVSLMGYHLAYRQFTGATPVAQGSGHTAFAPYAAFDAADARVMIGISNDRQFRRLSDALGHPEWPTDARFATNIERVKNRLELDGALQSILREMPAAHWTALLEACDVPVTPVQDAEQLLHDPQLLALEQLGRPDLPGQGAGVPKLPLHLSATPLRFSESLPSLGQHGRDILQEAGLSAEEIEGLVREGVCRLP